MTWTFLSLLLFLSFSFLWPPFAGKFENAFSFVRHCHWPYSGVVSLFSCISWSTPDWLSKYNGLLIKTYLASIFEFLEWKWVMLLPTWSIHNSQSVDQRTCVSIPFQRVVRFAHEICNPFKEIFLYSRGYKCTEINLVLMLRNYIAQI